MYYTTQRPKGTQIRNRKIKRKFNEGYDEQWNNVNR